MKRIIIYSLAILGIAGGGGSILLTQKEKNEECFCYKDSHSIPINFDLNKLVNRSRRDPDFMFRSQSVADTLAWKTFVALNWPADKEGNADTSICLGERPAKAVWESWKELGDIITVGRTRLVLTEKILFVPQRHAKKFNSRIDTGTGNYLFEVNFENKELIEFERLAERDTIVHWPVVDQNGNKTYFQTFYNKPMTDYIAKADLDDLEGVKKFSSIYPYADKNFRFKINGNHERIRRIHFPLVISGRARPIYLDRDPIQDSVIFLIPSPGSIMIKTAWKVISKDDNASRFYVRNATIIENDKRQNAKVGLVAMHIAIKYSELPQWLWATFEHTDNVPEIIDGKVAADPAREYSYYNSAYGNHVNESPDAQGRARLARLHPIPASVRELNKWMHDQMKEINPNSVWQYYDLVGSQWPSDPKLYPNDPNYDGDPRPRYLANAVIENFRQNVSCMSCHVKAHIKFTNESQNSDSCNTNFVMGLSRLNTKNE